MKFGSSLCIILCLGLVILPSFTSSKKRFARGCGGCATPCRVVSGIFAKPKFAAFGYAKVITIPSGACSINITEIYPTPNFLGVPYRSSLALRVTNGDYIFNGNWAIKWTGRFVGAGTLWDYKRQHRRSSSRYLRSGEEITANGPTDRAVDVMMIYRHKNRGIKYTYVLGNSKTTSTSNFIQKSKPKVSNNDYYERYKNYYGVNNPEQFNHYKHVSPKNSNTAKRTAKPIVAVKPSTTALPQLARTLRTTFAEQRGRPVETVQAPMYIWRSIGLSQCTKTCAGGVQITEVVCAHKDTLAVVTDENCNVAIKPQIQRFPCNKVECPPRWRVDKDWGPCSATCGQGRRTRSVSCASRISEHEWIKVSAMRCRSEEKPASLKACFSNPCGFWHVGNFSSCTGECGAEWATRSVRCLDRSTRRILDAVQCSQPSPRSRRRCPADSNHCWYTSKWSGQCDSRCKGDYSRVAFCLSRTGAISGQCAAEKKPALSRSCDKVLKHSDRKYCGGQWLAGLWSPCPATCEGIQKRVVLCMKRYGEYWQVLQDENCPPAERPHTERTCSDATCNSEWFASAWSPCTVTCGKGTRKRSIKCLSPSGAPSLTCNAADKPHSSEPCKNLNLCPVIKKQQKPLPRDPEKSFAGSRPCTDSFKQCHLMKNAGLCKYYRNACCKSCSA